MGLKEYHRKRDFSRTKEPVGKTKNSLGRKKLFVVQKHAASHLHYDFRLELKGVLKSWAVPKGPSLDPKVKHLAVHVEDHPMEYAHFEGIIPKGEYGGGTVMVWDIGQWEPLDENPLGAYHKGDLNFILHGKKLKGRWKLIKLKKPLGKGKEQWLLFKVKDEFSQEEANYDITKQEPYSAETERSMEQIAGQQERIWTREGEIKSKAKKTRLKVNLSKVIGAKKTSFPMHIHPQLATLVRETPKGDEWIHEIKWDGYRLIARVQDGNILLTTRRNNDWTSQFPSLVRALKTAKFKNVVLDGEIVALDKKKQINFQVLQNSVEESRLQVDLIFYVFDILYYDGYDLQDVPLIERKKILQTLLKNISSSSMIKYNDHIVGKGDEVFKSACDYSLEGIVSKRKDSRYSQKRTKDWLKIKCIQRQEFVIGGYTDPKFSRQYFGALLLGYYDKNNKLIYCGRVGTGFSQNSLKEISEILCKSQQQKCSFDYFPERVSKNIHWLRPKHVAEIEFLEMTSEGILRHPSFKGLREDKKPKEVILETPKDVTHREMMNMKADKKPHKNPTKISNGKKSAQTFTHLDRVFYPEQGLTKQDLLDYYDLVAKWILPHIKNRPLTLVRCPMGNHKQCFYQKHITESMPAGINSIDILEHGKFEPYISINNLAGLKALVQISTLEIHPWGSNNKNVESPDRIILDLDPSPEVEWQEVIQCAHRLKEFIDYLKLKNYVKTTGGKGLHIVIPIKPTLSWEKIREVSQRIADLMVEIYPQQYIATMSKAKRKGKIFIDYLRNTRGATAVAAYSTRARSNAPISVPIAWEELSIKIKSDTYNIQNINERLKQLKNDPWEDFFKTKQRITDKILKSLGL